MSEESSPNGSDRSPIAAVGGTTRAERQRATHNTQPAQPGLDPLVKLLEMHGTSSCPLVVLQVVGSPWWSIDVIDVAVGGGELADKGASCRSFGDVH